MNQHQLDVHTARAIAWVNAGKPTKRTTAKRLVISLTVLAGFVSVMYPFHANRFI